MSRRRRSGGAGEEGEGAAGMERWLLTYSDMITLLLALFVILFALSTINAKKFLAFKLGITQTFSSSPIKSKSSGLLPDFNSLVTRPTLTTTTLVAPPTTGTLPPGAQPLAQIAAEVNQALQAAGLAQAATTAVTKRSVVVQMLADKSYFALDSATLGVIGDRIVDTIAGVLRTLPNAVRVEGFTDNQAITGGPFTSNWQLSSARAANVAQRLGTEDGLTKNRLSAIGYSTTHPAVPNTSPANQAQNRRIDVVILTARLAAPAATGATGGSQ
ncbi:MAG: OmpA/MotB family protein [Acidimicrobiales bacterium]